MSFCTKCGNKLDDGAKFCTNCGNSVSDAAPAAATAPEATQSPDVNAYSYQPVYQEPMTNKDKTNAMGGWFKFIIYFALFAGALINLATGIRALTGADYGEDKEFYYEVISGLKEADTFLGVACIILAVYNIITRFRLSGFKKNAPIFLYFCYIANVVITIIYMVMITKAFKPWKINVDFSTNITNMIISIVFMIINIIYFGKRKKYFTE